MSQTKTIPPGSSAARLSAIAVSACACFALACSSGDSSSGDGTGPGDETDGGTTTHADGSTPKVGHDSGVNPPPGVDADLPPGVDANLPPGVDANVPPEDARVAPGPDGGLPEGWLYTSGNHVYVSNGNAPGTVWVGRGVNIDDIFFCGYDNTLWMPTPDATAEKVFSGLMSAWKPTFVRISLSMDSYPTITSWLTTPAQYKTPMTAVINALGANPNLHVLVTLRSEASMIGQDTADGDAEATGLPSDSTSTPNAGSFPTGTDATYVALVDTFASASYVLFGLTNEPGGDKLSNTQISAAMSHAVGTIRAEEDRLGVPHHIVSVQGNGWTSNIGFYAQAPLPYDNVVYEVHGYPPTTASYTYGNIPVIIGEYGTLSDSASFYADVEQKQIPTLAWDFDSYSNCAPDLVDVNQSDTTLTATAWGQTVQSYLLAHAP